MAGSTYGTILKVTTWGESHGKGIGVVVDGCPAGLPLTEADIQVYLDRRKPGQSKFTTARQEGDRGGDPLRGIRGEDHGNAHCPGGAQHGSSAPTTTGTSWMCTVRDTRTIPLTGSTGFPGLPGRRALLGP